jgi:hypothetical protein
MSRPGRATLLAVLLATSACKTANPDRTLHLGQPEQDVRVGEVPVRGSLAKVKRVSEEFVAEVLAVDEESLWLQHEGKEIQVPRALIQRVEIELYPSKAAETGIWTGFGTASTLSHGFFLLISAPVWLITGITASVSAARANTVVFEPHQLDLLQQYARFPQGMPPATTPEAAPPDGPEQSPM